jgi:DNA-binding response OmpR family regulator
MLKTILFIEDESAMQKTVGAIIQQEGYNMISALDGELGIKLAKEKHPDMILLDLVLPKKNGFDVLTSLKQDVQTKSIPIIVLTNLGEMENIDKAIELGATTYLVKSDYSLKEIIEKIKKILDSPSV